MQRDVLRERFTRARQLLRGRALARQCERTLHELGIPKHIGVEGLRAELERRQGRRITLVPLALSREGSGLTGAWWPGPEEDYICYERETGPIHRQQIILHEMSHILCNHKPRPVPTEMLVAIREALYAAMTRRAPDLDIARMRPDLLKGTVRLRGGMPEDEQEAEAEAMASLLGAQSRGIIDSYSKNPETSAVLQRLERALSHAHTQAR